MNTKQLTEEINKLKKRIEILEQGKVVIINNPPPPDSLPVPPVYPNQQPYIGTPINPMAPPFIVTC